MAGLLNSALGKVAISKETNDNLGVPSKDFSTTGTTASTAFYIEQDLNAPLAPQDVFSKEVKATTNGTQLSHQKDVIRGLDNVTLNFGNNVSKVDFVTCFMPMFLPHSYLYTATITDSTITAVSSVGNVVTITVTNAGTIQDGDYVVISNRPIDAENGTYEIDNLSSNSFDIVFEGGFDTEVIGKADAELNMHESVFEDLADCNKHRRESSFTIYQPYLWDKDTCSEGAGFITTGLVPKSGAINFVDSTYTIDMMGREILNDSTNLPVSDADYNNPINETGTYFDTQRPTIKDSLGEVQECLALDILFTNNVDESLKSYKSGKYNRVIIDGTTITGSYTLLFTDEEETANKSATIYKNRALTNNNDIYTIGLNSNDGSYFEITGNMSFKNVQKNPVAGGWELSMEFDMLYDYNATNITCKCVNGIAQSASELFATEA